MTETQILKKLSHFLDKKDYRSGLNLCDEFLQSHPESISVLRKRSDFRHLSEDITGALSDLDEAIKKNKTIEPADLHNRGWCFLDLQQYPEAIRDFTQALEVGAAKEFHYYDESCFFFRALAHLRNGDAKEALSDLSKVRDDFLIYLRNEGKVTKTDLVAQGKSLTLKKPKA